MNIANDTIGAAFRRAVIATTASLIAVLTLQAQESATQRAAETATEHASKAGDPASCIKEAAQMNMAIIKFAQLASQKAENPQLKRYSEKLETGHKQAQEKLENVARKNNVTLPTSLDPKCQQELTKLQNLSAQEFDKEFMKGAVMGHAAGIAKLQEASNQVKNEELAGYVKDMLSKMKEHQESAREAAKAVGLDQTTIASLESQGRREAMGTPGTGTESATGTSRGTSETTPPQERSTTPDR